MHLWAYRTSDPTASIENTQHTIQCDKLILKVDYKSRTYYTHSDLSRLQMITHKRL